MTRAAAALALVLAAPLPLAGCMEPGAGGAGGTGPVRGGDGPEFITDERGCLYEVILGRPHPIVYESGRQQCPG